MNFEGLKEFLLTHMRMSHVYQPVMIRKLLLSGGEASIRDLAVEILVRDDSQVEYYESIVKNMVGKVLTNRHVVKRVGKAYRLELLEAPSPLQVAELVAICEAKVEEYEQRRGEKIWSHRAKSAGYISGTDRYEVLKRAQFHCELCGISADEKALEVDHILPRNNGGTDELHNYQALCYSCNAMKRDRDDTDFRAVKASFTEKPDDCLFCHLPPDREILLENSLAYAISDGFPVTEGHSLIIPKRHVATYFDLSRPELNACDDLLRQLKRRIQSTDESVSGFNIGMNAGASAGQTIFHCHIHLFPRRDGDVENPRGGVRHLIPGKGHY
jgi:ATP adenylyltransferase